MRWTFACVRSLRVDADAVLAGLRVLALVHVRAVAAGLVEGVASVAGAAEDPVQVLADAVEADVVEQGTLINIDATLSVRRVRVHVTHLAFAGERSLEIKWFFIHSTNIIIWQIVFTLGFEDLRFFDDIIISFVLMKDGGRVSNHIFKFA